MTTIERMSFASLTPEIFHRQWRAKSRPLVITGAFDGIDPWTLEAIESLLGDEEYGVRIYGADYRAKPKREWKKYSDFGKYTARAYVGLLRDRTAHQQAIYMAQVAIGHTPLAATIRERVRELERRCDMEPMAPQDLNLWLGPAGHVEPLHFDTGDGTLMQLHGAKRVTLFAPAQTRNLYPFPFFREIPPWFSQVDLDAPDAAVFPRYGEAHKDRIDVLLQQGEILYIPVNWWHEVSALGSGYVCSVNRFWHVKPRRRNFAHWRSAVFWLMNHVPWKLVMAIDRTMRRVSSRGQST